MECGFKYFLRTCKSICQLLIFTKIRAYSLDFNMCTCVCACTVSYQFPKRDLKKNNDLLLGTVKLMNFNRHYSRTWERKGSKFVQEANIVM